MGAAEHRNSLMFHDTREHGVPPNENPGSSDLVDRAVFPGQQVDGPETLAGLDIRDLPDREPGALLRFEPASLACCQIWPALGEVPVDDGSPLDPCAVDGPRRGELDV